MRSSLALGARRTFLAFDGTAAAGEPVGPVPVLGAGEITGPAGFCAPFEGMAGPGQGRKFPQLTGPGLVPQIVPVSVWRVGPLAIGAFPAEITRQMGARLSGAIEAEAGGDVDRAVIAGLTNGYISYAATPEEYDACHYEGSFTLFGRRQGVRYMDVARGLSGALFSRSSAPPGAPEPPPLGITSDPLSPLRITPEAGEPVSEPEPVIRRYERASFRWRGGDPGVDAPRGSAFVSLQRAERGEWHTVSTEDSYFDLTHLDRDGVWNETHQFTECDPVGSYRFLVRGAADRGARPEPYEVASLPFELRPITSIQADPPVVSGGEVTVRARYPDPGAGAIVALPRVVRTGYAVLRITEPDGTVREVVARPDQERLLFVAPAREGSTAELLRIEDGCGNTGP